MFRDEEIPFAFEADRWFRGPPDVANLCHDHVWPYLRRDKASLRPVHFGWTMKDAGHVKDVMWNWPADSNMCLVRSIVLSWNKGIPYTVTAWFNWRTGSVEGADCGCKDGKSQRCRHVAALLLKAQEICSGNRTFCADDAPGAGIAPSEAEKPAASVPQVSVDEPGTERRDLRSFDPCESVPPASSTELEKLRAALMATAPDILWLRYAGGARQPAPAAPSLPINDVEDP
ncbi:uncharacterized protein LOC115309985 [Ixodes scapularis]|uniref:uncharacterized protein LOC115309985 n=1 Tax=Ixodes scapularis TaxID=6945 RepID=UPI001C38BD50|nr:uncharacterized protein LOC115309985 [Ixodes scapularis]